MSQAATIASLPQRRWPWLLSVVTPAAPALSAGAILAGYSPWWAVAPLVYYFGLVPLLDAWLGEDHRNPAADEIEALSRDPFYAVLVFATLPVAWSGFVLSAIAAGNVAMPWPAFVAVALSAGVASGGALVVAHELGHRPGRAEQAGARIAALLTGYAHFMIEHNRGHHRHVATPEDPASSRLGESVWRFALREIPGAARRGWIEQAALLARRDQSPWTLRNPLVADYAIATVIGLVLLAAFGPVMLAFLAIHHVSGWLQLTFANYVEHYGLCRQRGADGRYERVQPRHSWNTNHRVSNLLLFHLQRHSDHHAHPGRPYQVLRNFDDLPRLPSGYPGCFMLAALPPLWFAAMDQKVLDWAGNEVALCNVVPEKRPYYQDLAERRRLAAAAA